MKKTNIFDRLDAYIEQRQAKQLRITKLLVHADDLRHLFKADTTHPQLTGAKPFMFYRGFPVLSFKSQMLNRGSRNV